MQVKLLLFTGSSSGVHWFKLWCSLAQALVFTGSSSGVHWLKLWCSLAQALVFTGSSSGVHWLKLWCSLAQALVFTGSSSGVHWLKLWCSLVNNIAVSIDGVFFINIFAEFSLLSGMFSCTCSFSLSISQWISHIQAMLISNGANSCFPSLSSPPPPCLE